MKSVIAIAAAAAALLQPLTAGPEDYMTFVRQVQQSSGITWDLPNVLPKAGALSLSPLEERGALFQLWTVQKISGREYLLDQKMVGTYLPNATVLVRTLDPFAEYPRTRADLPFEVDVTLKGLLANVTAPVGNVVNTTTGLVNGLLPGATTVVQNVTSTIPLAASSVLLEHHLAAYTDGQTSMDPLKAILGTPFGSGFLTKNDLTTFKFARSAIKQPVTQKPFGEEHFTVHALSDGSLPQTKIAGNFVQVWPVASGAIEGITPGQVIRFEAPRLTVSLKDLYPGSYTFLRIVDEAGRKVVSDNSKFVLSEKPTETGKIIIVDDYSRLMPTDGNYTLQLVTQTPFGEDFLHVLTVKVDRTLHIRGQLGSLEN